MWNRRWYNLFEIVKLQFLVKYTLLANHVQVVYSYSANKRDA